MLFFSLFCLFLFALVFSSLSLSFFSFLHLNLKGFLKFLEVFKHSLIRIKSLSYNIKTPSFGIKIFIAFSSLLVFSPPDYIYSSTPPPSSSSQQLCLQALEGVSKSKKGITLSALKIQTQDLLTYLFQNQEISYHLDLGGKNLGLPCESCLVIDFGPSFDPLILSLSTLYSSIRIQEMELTTTSLTPLLIEIPQNQDISDQELLYTLKQALVGHPLHPYSSYKSNTSSFVEKPEQTKGINKAIAAWNKGLKKFLLVAPPGFGKTHVLIQVADYIQKNQREKPFQVFISDHASLVDQIATSLRYQPNRTLVKWGGDNKAKSIASLLSELRRGRKVILVTTTDSWHYRLEEATPNQRSELKKLLSFAAFDEVHHLPAQKSNFWAKEMIFDNAFLMGATATPYHYMRGEIEEEFDESFWAYISDEKKPKDLESEEAQEKGHLHRILKQLKSGIHQGEITSFNRIYLLSQLDWSQKKDDQLSYPQIFTAISNAIYQIHPQYLQEVTLSLLPLIKKHKQSLIVANNLDEANRLNKLFSLLAPEVTVKEYHSEIPMEERRNLLEKAKKGEPVTFISVRALDEAVDIPELSLYIDLNRSVRVTTLLQRMGRILRVAPGKPQLEVALFFDVDEMDVEDLLVLLSEIKGRGLSGYRVKPKETEVDELKSNKKVSRFVFNANWHTYIKSIEALERTIKSFFTEKPSFYTYEEAREVMYELSNVRTYENFKSWVKNPERDPRVPINPYGYYKDNGWTSWPDFLRKEKKDFYTYEEAREVMRGLLEITTEDKFRLWINSEGWDPRVPKSPYYYYKDKGWISMRDFLGTDKYTYEEAREVIHGLPEINTESKFLSWIRSSERDPRMPASPALTYKDKGWISWPDFLRGEEKKEFYTYEEAREVMRGLPNVRVYENFKSWIKNPERDPRVPKDPYYYYKDKGWISWPDFLGKEKKR